MVAGEAVRSGELPGFITKILVPRQRPDILSRPRLTAFVERHVDRKLIAVCAPAGYGKTTLLVDFAHTTQRPVCWYSLGPSDTDPQVFLEYLVAAIQRRFPDFGERTTRYLQGAGAKDLAGVVGLLVSEVYETIPEGFVLVLDDLHAVDSQPAIQALLDLLIPGLPPNCCCILASRSVPHIRFSRLVANRDAVGLGTADLRFTAAEIKQLFNRHYQLLLPDAHADELAEESEGWIAGIILTSHTIWQGLIEGLIRARRSGGLVFDYLAEEVFDQQEPRLQAFLLGSSVLPRLSPASCDTLLERADSAELLAALDESHLFLFRLEGEADWYRYHTLFQEFLQERLQRENPAEFGRLHRRAAELAEADGDVDAALDHYLRAGETGRAVDLVEREARATIDAGRVQTLLRWCERLPAGALDDRPRLQIERARAAFEVGDPALGEAALDAAWAAGQRTGDRQAIARTLIGRAKPLRSAGKYQEAIAACRAGLAIAEELGDPELLALSYEHLGHTLGAAGSFAEALPVLERALEGYSALADRYNQGLICHALGIARKRLGDVPRARSALDQAAEHWRAIGNAGMLAGTLVVRGNLDYELGETDSALRILGEAQRAAQESGYLRLAGWALQTTADVQRDSGHFDAAREAGEQSWAIAERVGDRALQIAVLDSLGRCHLYTGEFGQAQAAIRRARELAAEQESPYEQGIAEDTYGVVCLEENLLDQARLALEQACAWLESCGAVRELARARLHLAQVRFLIGERVPAGELARAALERLPGGAQDPLLVAEGKRLAPLLRSIGPGGPTWLGELLEGLGNGEGPSVRPSVTVLEQSPSLPTIRCYTLGRGEVEIDGRLRTATDWVTQKTRELWFYLLAEGPATRDQILEALWPEAEMARALSSFHTTAHRLRQTLFPNCIERRRGLWLVPPGLAVWTDDREFERLAQLVKERQLAQRVPRDQGAGLGDGTGEDWELAGRAVELYRGPYLLELDADWCQRRRQRLESLYLRLLQTLIARAHAAEQPERTIAYAELYLQTDPDNETVHETLMRAYVLFGNRPAALRHYQRYAEQLRDELDVAPSRRLRLLSEQLAREV